MSPDASGAGTNPALQALEVPAAADVALFEFVATALLLIAVVGSGIMAERLCGGNVGLALLANALATGGALVALILAFAAQSGAHMNPVVTLAAVLTGDLGWRLASVYVAAQLAGAIAGVWIAHAMFGVAIFETGAHVRTGFGQWTGEVVATFGLLVTIWGCRNYGVPVVALAVGAYITGAYWFTSSTSFANPAVTIARSLTDTFSGIRAADAPGFIAAQLLGTAAALLVLRRMR